MIELREWFASARFPDKPWLVLGKGPTFSRRDEFDLGSYNLLSLNHVVSELPVDVAHMIDVDVVEACAERIAENCRWLVMPRTPHVQSRPSLRRLDDFLDVVPVLRRLDEEGRLVWYNAATGPRVGDSPVIGVRHFSSEAALNILAAMGAKVVRSLGIDGGRGYSPTFEHLERVTMLANTKSSFDFQFEEIDRIVERHGLDYRPLVPPIRVFVGADATQLVAARVLEQSIRRHTASPVRFVPMLDLPTPIPKHRENRPRTRFSFSRFHIPSLCGYEGRAIYLDADMQVFGDIEELWAAPFDGKSVLCTSQQQPPAKWAGSDWFHPGPQMSVMVLDCSRLKWDVEQIVADLDAGRYSYRDLIFELCIVDRGDLGTDLPVTWNHLEHLEPGITKLLHYTVVPTQPWKNDDNELVDVWMDEYRDAVRAGAVPPDEVRELVAANLVKPGLLDALDEAPRPIPTPSSLALELAAVREHLDNIEGGALRRRVHQARRLRRYLTLRAERSRELGALRRVEGAFERLPRPGRRGM